MINGKQVLLGKYLDVYPSTLDYLILKNSCYFIWYIQIFVIFVSDLTLIFIIMETLNVVGGQFDPKSASCREFDVNEIHKFIAGSGPSRAWLWGFENGTIVLRNLVYRFSVNGYHHKGYVYIVLDGSDTFTIYYTNKSNTIAKISDMVYIDDLIDTIDIDVERISEYIN